MAYNKRTWLNKEGSASTGNVVAFDSGVTTDWRNLFLSVSSCSHSARLHKAEEDSVQDFIDKMELLQSEIGSFVKYLKQEEAKQNDKVDQTDT